MVLARVQRILDPLKQIKSAWVTSLHSRTRASCADMLLARGQACQPWPAPSVARAVGASPTAAKLLIHEGFRQRTLLPTLAMTAPQSVQLKQRLPAAAEAQPLLAYELEQGTLAKWCTQSNDKPPPTAVLVHGILGNRRNLKSFTRMLLQEHPAWQVLLVDLRSHGESPSATFESLLGPSSVDTAAADVLVLLRHLHIFPNTLIGHSFGGKVVLSMTEQFGPRLPRPVSVWVLDTVPGTIRDARTAGAPAVTHADHPRHLIHTLRGMSLPIANRSALVQRLQAEGFSDPIARWAATNLRPSGDNGSLAWSFDLEGIAAMYESYENKSHWQLLESPPQGLSVHFVRAEHSSFRWSGGAAERIKALGHAVHLLRDAGHWVHTDNPQGLLDIMAPAFGQRDDVRAIHQSYEQAGSRAQQAARLVG
eukprot:jgi/Ulvmu1/9379/UM051_0006.1